MVGHDQEIERPDQPGRKAGRGNHRLALGKAQRLVRAKRVADLAGIGGIAGVQVGIAKEHPVRVTLVKIRGLVLAADLDVFLCHGDVLCSDRKGEQEAGGGG